MKPDLKFKLDENLPYEAVEFLLSKDYDAITVTQQRLNGFGDPVIAARCKAESRAIITIDLDFADERKYPPIEYAGIIVLRFAKQGFNPIMHALRQIVRHLDKEQLEVKLWILTENRLRIRGERKSDGK